MSSRRINFRKHSGNWWWPYKFNWNWSMFWSTTRRKHPVCEGLVQLWHMLIHKNVLSNRDPNNPPFISSLDSWFWRFIERDIHIWWCCPTFAWVIPIPLYLYFHFLFMLICMACSSQALFPGNEVAEIYHEMGRKVTLSYSVYFVVY